MDRIAARVPKRRVVQAYQAVFRGNGTVEDAHLVMDDLEAFTGFLDVTPPDAPDGATKYAEGQRSVYHRIHALMRITDETLDTLEARSDQP